MVPLIKLQGKVSGNSNTSPAKVEPKLRKRVEPIQK